MSNKKITQLPEITSAGDTDPLAIVDLSTNITSKITKANLLAGVTSFIYNVQNYGAIGNGVADDSTAIQAAIAAANAAGGGTVFFPIGTYLCNTVLTLLSRIKLEGQSFHGSTIKCSNGNNLFTYATNISHLEIYNLNIEATAGHIFYNTSASGKIGYAWVHHNFFTQNSSDKCQWYQTNGNMISMFFEDNYYYTAGATRSISAWYNIDPHGGANSNWWHNNTFEMEGSSAFPMFYIECQTLNDYTYDNHWFENVFEVCNGGGIKLLSTFGSVIDGNYSYDTTNQVLPFIYLGKSSLGIRSTNTTIRNCGRIGSHIQAGTPDFQFDSHTRQVVIDSCRTANDTLLIDCGGCSQVTFINLYFPGGTTVINPPSGGFVSAELHDNGGMGYDVKAFGATGDGVTDDSAAIQACINYVNTLDAPSGTILFPVGVYLVNTVLTVYTKLNFVGQGYTSQIKTTGSNAMFTYTGSIAWTRFENLRMTSSAGDIFAPGSSAHWSQGLIEKCWISQSSSSKYIMNQPTGTISNLTVRKCDLYAAGAARSVPAWYMLDATAGSHDNTYENNVCTYGDTCNNQPFFYMECTAGASGYLQNPRFVKNQFETCDGGSIKLLSVFGAFIEDCQTVDNSSMELPFILIDKSGTASALPSSNNTIINCGRINGAVDTGVKDIKLGSSTRGTLISGFRCSPDNGTIDCGLSSHVTLFQISTGTTVSNLPTSAERAFPTNIVTISNNTTTGIVDIALAASAMTGGTILWTATSTDATDVQSTQGITIFSAVNKAGSYTTAIKNAIGGTADEATAAAALSAGTMTVVWTITTGTNKITLNCKINSSKTSTGYPVITYQILSNNPQIISIL